MPSWSFGDEAILGGGLDFYLMADGGNNVKFWAEALTNLTTKTTDAEEEGQDGGDGGGGGGGGKGKFLVHL